MRLVKNKPNEIWKDVVGFEGVYMVSNIGRVKRVTKRGLYSIYERLVSTPVSSSGYKKLNLCVNNIRKHTTVHLMVWDAFGTCARDNKDFVVDHIDNNKLNNRIDNLQFISQRLNSSKDRVRKYGNPVGVYKSKKRWTSKIHYDGRSHYIGSFETKEAASLAYQNKVKELAIKAA